MEHVTPAFARHAIIDLGSNSARAVVYRFQKGQSFHLEDEVREVVRLREGMTSAGLSEDAMTRGVFTLRLFQQFCQSLSVERVLATATSAVREAANGGEFLERVERETGIHLRILDGEQEAFYGVLGALSAVPLQDGVVLDIGGGSAQLSRVRERRFETGQALTLGALALTERFISHDPIRKSELQGVKAEIERQLDTLSWLGQASGPLVGLGGTIRNLAKIEAARLNFPLQSINGFVLSRASIDETIRLLSELPLSRRKRIRGLVQDRADIILPGALVVRAVLERLGAAELTVSEFGLREGVFLEGFWSDLPYPVTPDLREWSVLNEARFYGFQEAHARQVRFLAERMFDALAPLHGYGAWERELLGAAAMLHDIGMAITYNDHHKHSQTLIAANALPGYSSREIALIALLARFHRKGTPVAGEFASLLQRGDDQRLTRLSALLRLSEHLERSRTGLVQDVSATWDQAHLRLGLTAHETPFIELWSAQRSAMELMKAAFGRSVALEHIGATL